MVTELGVSSVKHVDGISQHNDDSRLGAKDRKSTRLNSSHLVISYAVFCLKKKTIVVPLLRAHRFVSRSCSFPARCSSGACRAGPYRHALPCTFVCRRHLHSTSSLLTTVVS